MMTPFEDLIHELGAALGMPLHIDHHGACTLQMNEKIRIQIEPDTKEDKIAMAAYITELSPGKFREEVLKEALKANASTVAGGSMNNILGFCARHNEFACHAYLPLRELNTEKLLPVLVSLAEYSISWLEAIQSGRHAPPGVLTKPTSPTPFGLRP